MTAVPSTYLFELPAVRGRRPAFTRILPVCEVAPGVSIAILNLLGDVNLAEETGLRLAELVPMEVEVLVMPDGKAQSLLHVVQRWTRLEAVVPRKERKSYMQEPVVDTLATSITTKKQHAFYLDGVDIDKLRGRRVAILDDIVSSGGTIEAVTALLERVGATVVAVMAIGTEGERRDNVIALHHFPVFLT